MSCPRCECAEVRWYGELGLKCWVECRDCGTIYQTAGVGLSDDKDLPGNTHVQSTETE